jgi:hypothetical protein
LGNTRTPGIPDGPSPELWESPDLGAFAANLRNPPGAKAGFQTAPNWLELENFSRAGAAQSFPLPPPFDHAAWGDTMAPRNPPPPTRLAKGPGAPNDPNPLANPAAGSAKGKGKGGYPPQDSGAQSGGAVPRVFSVSALETMLAHDTYFGSIHLIARDQAGCRMLQRKLSECDQVVLSRILVEVLDIVVDLMVDPFGNYLCQKLVEVSPPENLGLLIGKVQPHIVRIALDPHGTRAVQKLLEVLKLPEHMKMVATAMKPSIIGLIKDVNGNHVVQRALHSFNFPNRQLLTEEVTGHCVEIATHRHGCCVLQRCMDVASQQQRSELLQEIILNALLLVQDPFGNYVVQYVLRLGLPHANDAIAQKLNGHLSHLSTQKFSSNVVEQCLLQGSEPIQRALVVELCNIDTVRALIADQFGNYVIQRALGVAQEPEFSRLVELIRPCMAHLKETAAGCRIGQKLTKKYPQLADADTRGARGHRRKGKPKG